jgi:hypothetical protein
LLILINKTVGGGWSGWAACRDQLGYIFWVAPRVPMKDMQAQLEKLRADAEECALISKLATDKQKRELFARLSEHLKSLALEVERAMA